MPASGLLRAKLASRKYVWFTSAFGQFPLKPMLTVTGDHPLTAERPLNSAWCSDAGRKQTSSDEDEGDFKLEHLIQMRMRVTAS
ncbi:hypothetical protein PGTUg99_024788 [Puccinia graminis f. sp. tritici]|uniref:Uncharacterized protein n=1 Tax=Puccinia graminis f. sp. tritici TaxID=56615 RepID=A0A5B0RT21_PUCGR|nr:hypothetical protein PGTUg99_024788 [Puccinia graminis f. sp. tritici]